MCNSAVGMEKAPSTPVKETQSPHVDLLNYIHAAIVGTSGSNKFTEDMITPEMRQASPENLFLSIKQQLYKDLDAHFIAKGIDKATIDRLAPTINKAIEEAVEEYKLHSPLKSPLKQEIAKVLDEASCSHFLVRHANTEKIAFSLGNLVVVDAQRIQAIAPSPLSREMIYNHELSHAHNNDSAIRMAVEAALKENNKELSPDSKNFLSRTQEVIADLGPMSKSHKLAAAGVRVMARMVKASGPGVAAEHPAHSDRFGYSKAMSAITRAAEMRARENAENRPPAHAQSPSKLQPETPVRVLHSRKRLIFEDEGSTNLETGKPVKRVSPEKPTDS